MLSVLVKDPVHSSGYSANFNAGLALITSRIATPVSSGESHITENTAHTHGSHVRTSEYCSAGVCPSIAHRLPHQGRGGNRGGNRGGRGGGRGGSNANGGGASEKKPREAILDLGRFVDKEIRVKFQGGREVVGVLKGYDQLQNLVLDEVREEPTGMSAVTAALLCS